MLNVRYDFKLKGAEMESSALVLLSGGMDSAVLLYYVKDVLEYPRVEAILFDYDQSHRIELQYAQDLASLLAVQWQIAQVPLKRFGKLGMIIPARNSIFLSFATAYAEIKGLQDIFIGANAEDFKDFPDCRPEYIRLMSQALSTGNNIRGVYAPFVNKSKQEIVKIGRSLGVDFSLTWSCYYPKTKNPSEVEPCGKCHACIERNAVL